MVSLLQKLTYALPFVTRYWVAFSGGVDSQVLLHQLHQEIANFPTLKLHAIHVNHHLNHKADAWQHHCQITCEKLQVSLEIISIRVDPQVGESLEEVARRQRYQALSNFIHENDCLVTAHHQDDQAETLLLQLFRGAGPKGLSAMPFITTFAKGFLARPMLDQERRVIMNYAITHQLTWIDDDSNQNNAFDRNYIRQEIMPVIKQRWPSVAKTISRSAQLCAQTEKIIHDKIVNELKNIPQQNGTLDLNYLRDLAVNHQAQLIRYWLIQQKISLPNEKKLLQILNTVINARVDANPCVKWRGGEVRRYRHCLYAFTSSPTSEQSPAIIWHLKQPLIFPSGTLIAEKKCGKGLLLDTISQLRVEFNVAGACCKISGRGVTKTLKNLFQEWGVPPWERSRVPLLFDGKTLVAIVGYAIGEPYITKDDELGWEIKMQSLR